MKCMCCGKEPCKALRQVEDILYGNIMVCLDCFFRYYKGRVVNRHEEEDE